MKYISINIPILNNVHTPDAPNDLILQISLNKEILYRDSITCLKE